MKKLIFALYLLSSMSVSSTIAQNFIIEDSLCAGQALQIQFDGSAQEFCINKKANFLKYEMRTESISSYPENETPLFSHFVKDEFDNYYGFATNFTTNNIVRLEFGPDLMSVPVASSFSLDEVSDGLEGIQILFDNNQWWGFVTGGNGIASQEFILRLNFGSSLSNDPLVENLGGIGDLSFPHDLFFYKEANGWFGITLNKFSNTLTRFDFGDDLGNMPVASNQGNIGDLFRPTGFSPIQIDGLWHLFITNSEISNLSRLDFGPSISNLPNGINLGSIGLLNRPRDLLITNFCEQYFGLVLNRIDNEMILLDFGNDITKIPSATSLGNFGDLSFPHSISNIHFTDLGIVIFICNVDSKQINRLLFEFPVDLQIDCQEDISYFEITYEEPGIYDLQIIIDQNLPTQNTFCKEIFVTNCEDCIVFPNVFSPNDDGIHEVFQAINYCDLEILGFELEIYNRWGERVFQSDDPEVGWDGYYKGTKSMTSVFVWKAKWTYLDGLNEVEKIQAGDLSLMR